MAEKSKIFLSSPMPTNDLVWETIRDSITALFEYSPLSVFFELVKIDSEGGEPPDEIYLKQVADSHIILAIFNEEIRQGQRKEILKGVEQCIPIIAAQQSRTLNGDTNEFIKEHLYKHTTVKLIKSHQELVQYIISSLSGMINRRLKPAKGEIISAKFAAQSPSLIKQDFRVIAEFCQYCLEEQHHVFALILTDNLDLSLDRNFLLRMAVLVALEESISDEEKERLALFNSENEDANIIKLLLSMTTDVFDTTIILDDLHQAQISANGVSTIYNYLQLKDSTIPAQLLIETWESLDTVKSIKVFGISIFHDLCESIEHEIQQAKLTIDVNLFLPEIEKCLNCMPRDSGEWVIIYPEVGDLYDLILENLDSANQDIPWYNYELFFDAASCGSCNSPVEIYDTVYSDYPDRDDDF